MSATRARREWVEPYHLALLYADLGEIDQTVSHRLAGQTSLVYTDPVPEAYSTYEAKSRFSEIIRRVRQGRRIVISHRGQPVAEIVPIACEQPTLAERLGDLERAGVVVRARLASSELASSLRSIKPRPGALRRFLASRD